MGPFFLIQANRTGSNYGPNPTRPTIGKSVCSAGVTETAEQRQVMVNVTFIYSSLFTI